ncbi:uncharacterized protein LOC124553849 isoform X5 [Schistocerca americana]|uniref:uncharacterized protein LOC124553849 isoform X5 n=1 Tax=Schistocerca americana TaxID=7009 RepID=UPI001F504139|nr:uncharacterized protein LOC124553849 isoform X5 [Schistocerca americana]
MDVRRDTCCSVGNRRRRDSWASSCSERSEDEDRRDQGVAMTIVTLNAILDDNNRMFEFLRSFGVLGDKYICAKCRKLMSCAKVPPKRCRDLLMWRCRKDDVWSVSYCTPPQELKKFYRRRGVQIGGSTVNCRTLDAKVSGYLTSPSSECQ